MKNRILSESRIRNIVRSTINNVLSEDIEAPQLSPLLQKKYAKLVELINSVNGKTGVDRGCTWQIPFTINYTITVNNGRIRVTRVEQSHPWSTNNGAEHINKPVKDSWTLTDRNWKSKWKTDTGVYEQLMYDRKCVRAWGL